MGFVVKLIRSKKGHSMWLVINYLLFLGSVNERSLVGP